MTLFGPFLPERWLKWLSHSTIVDDTDDGSILTVRFDSDGSFSTTNTDGSPFPIDPSHTWRFRCTGRSITVKIPFDTLPFRYLPHFLIPDNKFIDFHPLISKEDPDPDPPPPTFSISASHARATFAVFEIGYTRNSKLYRRSQTAFELQLQGDHLVYQTPPLGELPDSQSDSAIFKPNIANENIFYEAFAFCKFLRLPVVFESSDAGISATAFVGTLIRHVTGAFRRFPSLVDLLAADQFDLLLKIDNFSSVSFQRLVEAYQSEMLKFCRLREFRVLLFRDYDSEFQREIQSRKFPLPSNTPIATTLIVGCCPQDFPDVHGDPFQQLMGSIPILERLQRIFRSYALSLVSRTDTIVIADIGQWASTLALASQVAGSVLPDGAPGSVRYVKTEKPHVRALDRLYVQITTRDRDSVAANALVLAAALAMGHVVVVPVGLPADALLKALARAIQDFQRLMLLAGLPNLGTPFKTEKIIIVGPPRSRELEGLAAERLVRSIVAPVMPRVQGTFGVQYTSDSACVLRDIDEICTGQGGFDGKLIARVLAVFGTVNDFAEFLGLE